MEEGLENLGAGFEGMEYAEGEGLLAQGVGLEYVEREEGVGYEGVYQEGAHYGEDLQGGGDFGGQGGGDFSGQGGDYGGQYGEAGGFGGGAGFEHDPHGLVDEGLMGGGMEEGFEEQEELLPQGHAQAFNGAAFCKRIPTHTLGWGDPKHVNTPSSCAHALVHAQL
eukprot:1138627-Pelagomonas_calceolata.AAC.5